MNIKDLRIQLNKFVDKHGPVGVEEECSGRQTAPEMSRKAKFVMRAIESTQTDGSMAQLALRTCALMLKGNLAPAGNFHLCLMFGPLIFESGVPR